MGHPIFGDVQVHYIMFAGTGSLIVQSSGDVVATNPRGRSTRMEQNLVMGFDSRLTVGVNRTEVFWPYLRRRTPLVDDEFTGLHPLFWQKSSADGPSNPIAKDVRRHLLSARQAVRLLSSPKVPSACSRSTTSSAWR